MSDTPRMDAYPIAVVERAIHEALHPQGASTHDGKVKLDCSHVTAIIARGRAVERELTALRAKLAAAEKDAERYRWLPIETAPKNNECPLLLARFNDDGSLQSIDHDGAWTSESESWELPNVYYFWASANGYVEEPSHWMYQPSWYAAIEKERGNV